MLTENWYAAMDADGWVLQWQSALEDDEGPNPLPLGGHVYVRDLATRRQEAPPTPTSRLRRVPNSIDFVWVETASLAEARANAWSIARDARDAAETAPFEWDGSMFDPNKANVAGAALAALIAQMQGVEVLRNWTLADNSIRALTGPQLIALGIALTEHVDAVHQRGRVLRELIDNAASPAEAYGYTWDSLNGE